MALFVSGDLGGQFPELKYKNYGATRVFNTPVDKQQTLSVSPSSVHHESIADTNGTALSDDTDELKKRQSVTPNPLGILEHPGA